jgi:predicted transcriptional regulator of viral defense system
MPVLRPDRPAGRDRGDTEAIAKLATHQHGVISHAQLSAAGIGRSRIARWVASARLHPVHPEVFALGHAALSLDGRLVAAVLYGGDQAVLSHTTAAWMWSLIDAVPTRIHLTTPGRRSSLPGVRVHRTRELSATSCRGLPVTPVARTLVDLAGMVRFSDLRRALAEADYRGLLEPAEIGSVLKKGRRGSRALRAALDVHLPQLAETLSVLEERFLELCELAGVPTPEINARVGGMMVDALWRDERLVVELDGAAAHGGWAQVSRDRQRDLTLRRLGFRVLRYTWHQVTATPTEVAADLHGQLLRPVRPA